MEKIKYPQTPHFPWSRSQTEDDSVLKNVNHFVGKEVVVTEKMDGENTTFSRSYYHARSRDSLDHLSQHYVKALHAGMAYQIPEGWRVCGENVYAKHTLFYQELPSYFLVFSIWNEKNQCLSWDETMKWCQEWGLVPVPELYRGTWDEHIIRKCYTKVSSCGGKQEGYVVRLADDFSFEDFHCSMGKFVRPDHVQTDKHWKSNTIIPNRLKKTVFS